ncbi:uncharacterized protein G2W53_008357 [Senna tora]|uniref:Uncharacterized protein n=1 Tax=Senna tora TaxID=362788 RepID=A0A834X892_9FABA|nr:uncharacterized protein G2W53_008357 [Senna tora]
MEEKDLPLPSIPVSADLEVYEVQNPQDIKNDHIETAHKQRADFHSLTNNDKDFPAHLKWIGFHSLTNNDNVFPLT